MNKPTKSETVPVTQPAPQLPNIPASADDPFQPDTERQAVTPEPDDSTTEPQPGSIRAPRRPRNPDEELPTTI